jgi:thiamine biosynthesis lipoprotein
MVSVSMVQPETPAMQLFDLSFRAMASPCEIVVAAASGDAARLCVERAIGEVRRIEQKYSRYRDDSVLSKINASAGMDWVHCDEETNSLLDYAQVLYENSDGLFDITSGVLRRVWDFKQAIIPSQQALDAVLPLIGWDKVERKNSAIRLAIAGMEIDFGGYGKEYAVDRAASLLEAEGVIHGYVNLGGDLRVIGPKPDGQPWQMGIRHPRKEHEVFAYIPIERGALATSGDYERYFEHAGKRYCHVLNPQSGQPASGWQSISVLAPAAVAAGSITTIAMLKTDKAIEYLEASGFSYLAIDHAGRIYQTAGQRHQP